MTETAKRIHWADRMVVDLPEGEVGEWKLERKTITKDDEDFQALRAAISGSNRYPEAGTYHGLLHRGQIIMSDTRDEKRDHWEPIHEAERRGRENVGGITCLVNGLGLGMVTVALLSIEAVAKVTVIEIAPEVIELVGTHLSPRYGERLEIIEADALTWRAPKGQRFSIVWSDIWPTISQGNFETMGTLHRKYGRRCDWQGSWSRHIIKYQRDRDRRNGW